MSATPAALPNLRARQRAARRRKFIDTAEALFLRHGFAGTSVNEVVRLSGGSLATLYAEFGTKEALFEAVIGQRVDAAFTAAAEALPPGNSIESRLARLAGRIHERTLSAASLAMYRLAVAEGPRFAGLRDAVLRSGLDAFLERLATLFASPEVAAALAIDDRALAARRFLALVQGQHQFIAGCGDGARLTSATRTRHLREAVAAFLQLYRRPAASAQPRTARGATRPKA